MPLVRYLAALAIVGALLLALVGLFVIPASEDRLRLVLMGSGAALLVFGLVVAAAVIFPPSFFGVAPQRPIRSSRV